MDTTSLLCSGYSDLDAVNEGAHLSRIMYNEQVRQIRFRLSKFNVPAVPLLNIQIKFRRNCQVDIASLRD